MKLSNKQALILLTIIVAVGVGLKIHQTYFSPPKDLPNIALINHQIINIELADTPQKQILGLSGRAELGENSGMLFVFNNYAIRNFWMKDMLIPIDIIWIKNNQVVGVTKNAPVPTEDEIPLFKSPAEVNLVLEVNAGYTTKYNIKTGDKIHLDVQNKK